MFSVQKNGLFCFILKIECKFIPKDILCSLYDQRVDLVDLQPITKDSFAPNSFPGYYKTEHK